MLRRDFLAAVALFTAAGAAAKAVLASAKTPQEKAGEFLRDLCCRRPDSSAGAVLVPQEFSDALSKALDERSLFERTLVDCLRDGSMILLGVTSHAYGDYKAVYLPAAGGRESKEQSRHESLMAMYDRGLIVVERVNVFNGYTGVEIVFSICTR